MPPTDQSSPHARHVSPQVARVDIRTLSLLRDALDGKVESAEVQELRADLEHLLDQARWAGEPL